MNIRRSAVAAGVLLLGVIVLFATPAPGFLSRLGRFTRHVVVAGFFSPQEAPHSADEHRQPVYVGAKVCERCHDGADMGHQYSLWLLAKHSKAWAVLATPEAKQIAVLSGIPYEPQDAGPCLGCHATAWDTESWERDPTFAIEDGVQCERCHGPGSEYMDEATMLDPAAAAKAGLKTMTKHDCELCHYEKGSHVAVTKKAKLDIDEAWKKIAHPAPWFPVSSAPPVPAPATKDTSAPKYAGVDACATCHSKAKTGYQFSLWRLSPHAEAYAVLATDEAGKMARKSGVSGEPQRAPECLRCHATGFADPAGGVLDGFSVSEGVGCESCHGPGSDYMAEAIMTDPRSAEQSGLRKVTKQTCLGCHEGAHGKPFDVDAAWQAIAHPMKPVVHTVGPRYKTPVNLAFRPRHDEIWVACEASGSVIIVDTKTRKKVAEIPVGGLVNDVAFSPDGSMAYVSARLEDSVFAIDASKRTIVRKIPVGDDPHGVLTNASGKLLYVLDTSEDEISVVDTASLKVIRTLAASRNPWSLSLSPGGRQIFVTNNLAIMPDFRKPTSSEVTELDAAEGRVSKRLLVPDTNLIQGVSWEPNGEFALVTINRTKNLVPMTRILQGWTITNGLGILWKDGRVDQVLLDEPNMYFPDAADVAITPDGRKAVVTSSGSDRVAVVNVPRLVSMLRAATPREREHVFPNDLGKSTEFVIGDIPTGYSPRGIVVAADSRTAWAANAIDDSLSVLDIDHLREIERVDLGGPKEITQERYGERLFHSANIAFQRQFSCHSCHPDGHVDGITYDIEPDGIGYDPVDNRTLRGILDTDPFKWSGLNKTLGRQCGPRLAVFFTRIDPFTPTELAAVVRYISTIPRPPNRFRPIGAELTEAQRRGKKIFERAVTNDGREIPPRNRCVTCHFPPLYTDRTIEDVGTKMPLDKSGDFDVPALNNIYGTAPYLHDGIAKTLEEIWTRFNPEDKHGYTNDLTKDQLNDLIEFLKTL